MNRVKTTRFGEIEVRDEDRLEFPEGILGFAPLTRYCLHQPEGLGLFWWLQSEQVPELAFVVCDPRIFKPDYQIEVGKQDLDLIALSDPQDASILVILSHPQEPRLMTANLLGPLVVNRHARLARQLVLNNSAYSSHHAVFGYLYGDDDSRGARSGEKEEVHECA
jgi:flagellar assembly factor FliW